MKKLSWILALAGTVLISASASTALAEGENNAEVTEMPRMAAWAEPISGHPDWLDATISAISLQKPEIIAAGNAFSLIRLTDGLIHAIDASAQDLGTIAIPQNASWIAIQGDRILALSEGRLWAAASLQNAASPDGFVPVLDLPDARFIDAGNGAIAYADAAKLSIVDLNSGALKQFPLADFFNDAKMAELTPEAVQKAESKKSKKSSKSAAKQNDESAAQVADIQGIWWRNDGTGLIRLRSLLNTRTYITRDNGRSWLLLDGTPAEIVHANGWIWDGKSRVLSRDGSAFVDVCGPRISPVSIWSMGHALTRNSRPGSWLELDSPEVKQPESAEIPDVPASMQTCTPVDFIPDQALTKAPELYAPHEGLYAPESSESGFAMGLYLNGSEDSLPTGWQTDESGAIQPLELPDACTPHFAAASHGLGVMLCEAPGNELTAYVKSQNSDWTAEALLPRNLGTDTNLFAAEDGSIILLGGCGSETTEVPVMVSPDDLAAGIESVPTETRTVYVCTAAVRQPETIGQENVWRIERLENVSGITPLTGGRMLSIDGLSQNKKTLKLRTATKTEDIAENFDPAPYSGLVMTDEGCFALYDGSIPPESLKASVSAAPDPETGSPAAPAVRLLSQEGRLAQLDCATSRAIIESGISQAEYIAEKSGDDHYGFRIGAGPYFAQDVMTWFMRIEGLIPIFHGQYEVGLTYRMAGGNTSAVMGHLGMVSVRWRYDQLELFDFAVGAGIGFGRMCGYDKAADDAANDGDPDTPVSAFQKCGNASMQYEISAFAAYKLSPNWKLYLSTGLLGGNGWGADISGGLEVRF